MRAFVVTAPHESTVLELAPPDAGVGQVVVDVARVGVCGTDVEFFTGEMAYLHQGHVSFPLRLGHEWCGTVTALGEGVDPAWLGRRVIGDTMLGCGHCRRCLRGHPWVCAERAEVGIRGGVPGALADQLAVPASSLHALPDTIDDTAGALVEPGGNALRAALATGASDGDRLLILGTGTIGLLAALFAQTRGVEVHLVGQDESSLALAAAMGFAGTWTHDNRPELPWDAVIDATNHASMPALAVDLVEPSGRVVFIGLSGTPSAVDTRTVALKDVTTVGILGGSAGLAGTISAYAAGDVDPRPLVAATVSLHETAAVLAGQRPGASALNAVAPKFHIDPRT